MLRCRMVAPASSGSVFRHKHQMGCFSMSHLRPLPLPAGQHGSHPCRHSHSGRRILAEPRHGLPPRPRFEVTYDGATSESGGTKASGAAAILWAPVDDNGQRAILAKRFVALPGSSSSELAEARGAALAIHLALDNAHRSALVRPGGPILIAGDNPVITRYRASQARRDSADVHAILEGPLSLAASSGRKFEWMIFSRALNPEAHDAATLAAAHAARLAGSGVTVSAHWSE